jgi:hypothetical protein
MLCFTCVFEAWNQILLAEMESGKEARDERLHTIVTITPAPGLKNRVCHTECSFIAYALLARTDLEIESPGRRYPQRLYDRCREERAEYAAMRDVLPRGHGRVFHC